MERVRVVGARPEGVGDEVPQKPKQNMKLVYNFLTFSCKKNYDLTSMSEQNLVCIFCKHTIPKKSGDSTGALGVETITPRYLCKPVYRLLSSKVTITNHTLMW